MTETPTIPIGAIRLHSNVEDVVRQNYTTINRTVETSSFDASDTGIQSRIPMHRNTTDVRENTSRGNNRTDVVHGGSRRKREVEVIALPMGPGTSMKDIVKQLQVSSKLFFLTQTTSQKIAFELANIPSFHILIIFPSCCRT